MLHHIAVPIKLIPQVRAALSIPNTYAKWTGCQIRNKISTHITKARLD